MWPKHHRLRDWDGDDQGNDPSPHPPVEGHPARKLLCNPRQTNPGQHCNQGKRRHKQAFVVIHRGAEHERHQRYSRCHTNQGQIRFLFVQSHKREHTRRNQRKHGNGHQEHQRREKPWRRQVRRTQEPLRDLPVVDGNPTNIFHNTSTWVDPQPWPTRDKQNGANEHPNCHAAHEVWPAVRNEPPQPDGGDNKGSVDFGGDTGAPDDAEEEVDPDAFAVPTMPKDQHTADICQRPWDIEGSHVQMKKQPRKGQHQGDRCHRSPEPDRPKDADPDHGHQCSREEHRGDTVRGNQAIGVDERCCDQRVPELDHGRVFVVGRPVGIYEGLAQDQR